MNSTYAAVVSLTSGKLEDRVATPNGGVSALALVPRGLLVSFRLPKGMLRQRRNVVTIGAMSVRRNKQQVADFASAASPHSWLIVAENLHLQALHLHQDRRGQAIWTEISADGHRASWDATNRAVFLLGGFALENAIKALLVHEFPEWVSNGQLARQLRTHSLIALERMSGVFPNRREHRWVLAEFEDGLDSWARYPCSLDADRGAEEMLMDEELWEGYLKAMKSLGRRLSWLLHEGWQGPHGVFEQWRAEGDLWLGSGKGLKALSRPLAISSEILGTSR